MKTTEELTHEIKDSEHILDYFSHNVSEMNLNSFPEYLETWRLKKGIGKAEIVRRSNLNRSYVYQIFEGRKYPSRDKVIALAIGMGLDSDETQTLLKQAGYRELYPRDVRDALLLYAISHGYDMLKINELLFDHNVEVLE